MDRHDIPGITGEEVAQAHVVDLALAPKYGVQVLSYWFDADAGAAFCLARAPTAADLATVHREGHGLVPNAIIPVLEGSVQRFLGAMEAPVDQTGVTSPFRTIAFTDLIGSTSLLNDVGESAYMLLLAEHDLIVRRELAAVRGREVKHTGDGFLVSFDDVTRALSWAIAIQDGFDARNATTDGPRLRVRIGMAGGEPVDRGDDLFGSTVNLASRLCDAADGGSIVVSGVVKDLGAPLGFEFLEVGLRALKGFPGQTALFELQRDRGQRA